MQPRFADDDATAADRQPDDSGGKRALTPSAAVKDIWLAEDDSSGPPEIPVEEQARLSQQAAEEDDTESERKIPDVLPILPLRNLVVFPLSFLPLSIGQARSVRLIEDVAVKDRIVGLLTSTDAEDPEPGPEKLHEIGTAAYIHRMVKGSDGNIGVFVQGLDRFRVQEFTETDPYLKARVEVLQDQAEESVEVEALQRSVTDLFGRLVDLVPHLPEELTDAIESMEDARALAYFIAANTRMETENAQELLAMESVEERLRALTVSLSRELEVLEIGRKIQREARGEMEKVQREYFLRQQLKAIKKELGEADEGEAELEQLEEKIRAAGMPEEAENEAMRELSRLQSLPQAAAEYGVIRTYLDWMVTLPWSKTTEDNLDIAHARKVLDEDHYDLDDIKERILEFLAVQKLRRERDVREHPAEVGGGILAFAGPPGTGKTSLGRSIARALGREFVRMSLGGLRDEAEIRGHRRTYIGAMPGRIVQGLKRAGTRNPVFMLDEIDKVGASFRGDPASALLEVLDPQQNNEFRDLYLDVPFDLSDVLFIGTANEIGQISGPLQDRMEIIELSGYTETDKVHIARGYLIPRQLKENGLRPDELGFSEDALRRIVRRYTREAGVRNLERQIGKVARKVAVTVAERPDSDGEGGPEEGDGQPVSVDADDVREYLGPPRFTHEAAERTEVPGVATGLAYTPYGGDVLFVEASAAPGEQGFLVTGQLGDVMKESAQAALSYVRAHHGMVGAAPDFFSQHHIHVHVPAGATPKDGPSAGVTIATALASLLSGHVVRSDVGMTGEITLRGKVLRVGGIKEKILAAHRADLRTVILPEHNEPDLEEVPEEVREIMTFHFADTIDDVWRHAFERPLAGFASSDSENEDDADSDGIAMAVAGETD